MSKQQQKPNRKPDDPIFVVRRRKPDEKTAFTPQQKKDLIDRAQRDSRFKDEKLND